MTALEHPEVLDTSRLEVLTDEELAVLCPGDTPVVTPYLSRLAARDRETALRSALRGLVARGFASAPGASSRQDADGSAPAEVELEVRSDLVHLVTLRRAATAVVALARTTVEKMDYVYLHVIEDVVLEEQVDETGLHSFAIRPLGDLLPAVLAAAVHPDAGDADGPVIEVDGDDSPDHVPPQPVLDAAGAALLRSDLLVLTPGEQSPLLSGLFSAPAGSWLFAGVRGSQEPIAVTPVRADGLRAHVHTQLAPLLQNAPAGGS